VSVYIFYDYDYNMQVFNVQSKKKLMDSQLVCHTGSETKKK